MNAQPRPLTSPQCPSDCSLSLVVRLATALAVGIILWGALPAGAIVVSIGHRGASALAPENTVASVEAAYGGAWGVECDPRITSDGQIVMMHDATVDRTTDGTGALSSLTLNQVRALDAGSWFSPAFAGEKVPTLAEQLAVAAAGNLITCLDIKAGTPSQYLPHLLPVQDRVEVHAFSWSFLEGLNALDDGFTLVALGSGDLASQVASLPACVDKVSWAYGGITASGVNAAHAAGIEVYAWTVNSATTMLSLKDMGVDGIVTDNPALATQVLNWVPPDPFQGLPRELHDGLMMNWSFDDALAGGAPTTVVDSVHGVDATLGPGMAVPSSWQVAPNAKMGGALRFDGSDDYASVPAAAETIPTGNAVTIATWVKLDRLPSALDESYGSIYDSSQDAYVLYLDRSNNELRFKVTAGAAARPGIPGAQLDTTQWHHVVAVYDGGAGVARIYLDGGLVDVHADDGSGSDGLTGLIGTQNAFFGCNGIAYNSIFEGKIDETAVWDRALGQGEIAHLYNGGLGLPVQQTNPVVEAVAPVVRLEFEGNMNNQGTGGATYNGQWINGASGNIAYEAGVNDQAVHLYNPDAPTGGDAVRVPIVLSDTGTISFWCKPDSFYDYQTLFDNSVDGADWEMWIYESGVARFRIEDDSFVECDLSLLEGADSWYHMAVTWFKTGTDVVLNLYVDGLLRDVDEGAWVDPGSQFYIGGGNTANDFANASFDDFRIYDAILCSDEIAAIFIHREAGTLPEIPGDATRDGIVDDEDAARMASYWGSTDAEWWMGDFNGDGKVDPADAAILAANWGQSIGESVPANVPEPTFGMLAVTAMLLAAMARRKRT